MATQPPAVPIPAPGRRGLPLFAATIFLSSFLLFQVQPIVARVILPWFGGSAAVWTTCMLFFQVVLLLGYLYSHWVTGRLAAHRQSALHIALLGVSLILLRMAPAAGWKPMGGENPTLRILGALATSVGLPYFLLSTTGPLVQAWYSRVNRGALPYRLFALSNLASLAALISYPLAVEPFLAVRSQTLAWMILYAAFAALCMVSAWRARQRGSQAEEVPAGPAEAPGWTLYLLWMLLPACASSMMLAVTNYLTQDVASIPFLWILPLSLYLLSFVLCFDTAGWYRRLPFLVLLAAALAGMSYQFRDGDDDIGLIAIIAIFSVGSFIVAMFCHGELARLKPHPRYLTSFYLMLSVGGALGGVFVGVVAPYLFRGNYELPVTLALSALLAAAALAQDPVSRAWFKRWQIVWAVLAAGCGFLFGYLGKAILDYGEGSRVVVRNFYGGLRVNDEGEEESSFRKLRHGGITHGSQWMVPGKRREPTTYYCRDSGVGLALIEANARRAGVRVGLIGLGAGTLAAYGRAGDYYRFYEINPLVLELANREFTFLKDNPARTEVVLGDARLSLEREAPAQFDVLAVDAFSGDSIPVHLLTREAIALYFRHLKPEGVLAVHISNRYVNLRPVLRLAAEAFHKTAREVDTDDSEDESCSGATWVLVASSPDYFQAPLVAKAARPLAGEARIRPWTDDYSNLLRILK